VIADQTKNWNPVVKALVDATPDIRYYPNFSCSAPLNTWVFEDRVALIGDAAHAHGGAFATGGSLAIDDAYALYLSLNSVIIGPSDQKPSAHKIGKALGLYEATRKPHAEKLLKVVHTGNAAKIEKIRKGIIEKDEELRTRAERGSNTGWLHEHDVVKAFEEVLTASETKDASEEKVPARL
jgi:salicylate hydroxylase